MRLKHRYIKRAKLLKLAQIMTFRYLQLFRNEIVKPECPVCNIYREVRGDVPNCTRCFNQPPKLEFPIIIGCTQFKTNDKNKRYQGYRLSFWEQALEYIETLKAPLISVEKIRIKFNEINNNIL